MNYLLSFLGSYNIIIFSSCITEIRKNNKTTIADTSVIPTAGVNFNILLFIITTIAAKVTKIKNIVKYDIIQKLRR